MPSELEVSFSNNTIDLVLEDVNIVSQWVQAMHTRFSNKKIEKDQKLLSLILWFYFMHIATFELVYKYTWTGRWNIANAKILYKPNEAA